MKSIEDTIETKDLYLASLWYTKGLLMENVRHEGKQCYFIFQNAGAAKELERRYFSKEELVIAKDYVNAVKTLKELIFR
ncbi:hypothetical protein KKB64_05155 [Patescibacteria group bacterium]|nr:hypothetical protein [Patescibacteria group bacterium]MBU1473140.1 hypothetical protein [Patescibacteria group bacterium]MBU2459531.1 hypothetical protein [Patescibacteria group bacterium]